MCNYSSVCLWFSLSAQSINPSSELINNEESLGLNPFPRTDPTFTLERMKETAEAKWMQ